jgi:hypothetical protein
MSVNWAVVYNRLFKIIDTPSPSPFYYGGPRYIQKVQEVREDFPNYTEFLRQQAERGRSTTRRDYYKDILMDLTEEQRAFFVLNILDDL